MEGSFEVTFYLKCDKGGSSIPYIIGDHPALGNNVISDAITLTQINGPYNYSVKITFDEPITEPIKYRYYFKTQFGAYLKESIPLRVLPLFTTDSHVYDTFNVTNPLSGVLIRLRTRVFTHYGQELYVSGNIPELGNWKSDEAVPLFFEGNLDYWSTTFMIPLSTKPRTIEYKYIVSRTGGVDHWEPDENHKLEIGATPSPTIIEIADQYRWKDPVMNAFTRATFKEVLNRRTNTVMPDPIEPELVRPTFVKTHFQVNCPYVHSTQSVVVVGSIPELGEWNPLHGLKLEDGKFPIWANSIDLKATSFPFEYKYVLSNNDGTFIWEEQNNRHCHGPSLSQYDGTIPMTLFVNEWFACPNKELFKGLGVYVPIFSLRTQESQGIGSYTDIKKLVDICNTMGASLIQLLPINDTTDKGEWADSYPYKQVSCFALHPVYIDLLAILDKLPSDIYNDLMYRKGELERLPSVDYPAVYSFKMNILSRIFKLVKEDFKESKEFEAFLKKNGTWLKPYALFCYLRDQYHTMEFRKWPKYSKVTPEEIEDLCDEKINDLLFIYWMQYIADKQFKESYDYATEHKVALKGDLPIGVNINSVECWAFPSLFRLTMCAGAPPDDFSSDGQNWGFPTYNWEEMEKDGFAWWRARLQRMAELYHTLRVDHILGFFRIWEIPRETCVRGLLGHFFPSNPLTRQELIQMGLWDIERYTKPYIRGKHLLEKFPNNYFEIAQKYLVARNISKDNDTYDFKPEYNNEKKIYNAVMNEPLNDWQKKELLQKLFELLGNVLLIEDPERPDTYHVRTEVKKESVETTPDGPIIHWSTSWLELPGDQRQRFEELYIDYTYRRQTNLWVAKADAKLGVLKDSTNMLICGEDLGQITAGIIRSIEEHALLSLRVQRMSKDPAYDFDDYNRFAYLSVACPSTHDTSSLRGWWEENSSVRQKFWYNVLMRHDSCPERLSTYFQEMILRQNLWSNSMWAIFLLQDLTGINESLRRQSPEEERINIPADPNHKWRYRYPYSLEELNDHKEFMAQMRGLVEASHRI